MCVRVSMCGYLSVSVRVGVCVGVRERDHEWLCACASVCEHVRVHV